MDKKQKIVVTKDGLESPIFYKEFWSPKVLDNLNKKIDSWYKGEATKIQYNIWPDVLVQDSGPILIFPLQTGFTPRLDCEELIADIKNELNVIYDTSALEFFDCGIHIFLSGSYIPWHDDQLYEIATHTYLNQERWDWNWGGALLYENKDGQVGAEFPEYNKLVVVSGNFDGTENYMYHGTTIVAASAPPRFTLQIFAGRDTPQKEYAKSKRTKYN